MRNSQVFKIHLLAHHEGRQRNQDILDELVRLDQQLEKSLACRQIGGDETHERPQEVGDVMHQDMFLTLPPPVL